MHVSSIAGSGLGNLSGVNASTAVPWYQIVRAGASWVSAQDKYDRVKVPNGLAFSECRQEIDIAALRYWPVDRGSAQTEVLHVAAILGDPEIRSTRSIRRAFPCNG